MMDLLLVCRKWPRQNQSQSFLYLIRFDLHPSFASTSQEHQPSSQPVEHQPSSPEFSTLCGEMEAVLLCLIQACVKKSTDVDARCCLVAVARNYASFYKRFQHSSLTFEEREKRIDFILTGLYKKFGRDVPEMSLLYWSRFLGTATTAPHLLKMIQIIGQQRTRLISQLMWNVVGKVIVAHKLCTSQHLLLFFQLTLGNFSGAGDSNAAGSSGVLPVDASENGLRDGGGRTVSDHPLLSNQFYSTFGQYFDRANAFEIGIEQQQRPSSPSHTAPPPAKVDEIAFWMNLINCACFVAIKAGAVVEGAQESISSPSKNHIRSAQVKSLRPVATLVSKLLCKMQKWQQQQLQQKRQPQDAAPIHPIDLELFNRFTLDVAFELGMSDAGGARDDAEGSMDVEDVQNILEKVLATSASTWIYESEMLSCFSRYLDDQNRVLDLTNASFNALVWSVDFILKKVALEAASARTRAMEKETVESGGGDVLALNYNDATSIESSILTTLQRHLTQHPRDICCWKMCV